MGLNLNDMPVQTPKLQPMEQPKTMTTEMQEVRAFMERNKAEIAKSINKQIEEQSLAALKYENSELKKNLTLAAANIEALDRYLKGAMEQTQKETAAAIAKVNEKVDTLLTSNNLVAAVMKTEGKKMAEETQGILRNIGDDAENGVRSALRKLESNFNQVLTRHQQIAAAVDQLLNENQWKRYCLWAWRWVTFMTLTAIAKRYFAVDNPFSMIKIWLFGFAI